MILEEERQSGELKRLKERKKILELAIEMAEPYQHLIDNPHYEKILSFHKRAADYYDQKIKSLAKDLANTDENETPLFRNFRIADIMAKVVVARDTLLDISQEPQVYVEEAKRANEELDEVKSKIRELEESNGR